jgi:hypothetical protein
LGGAGPGLVEVEGLSKSSTTSVVSLVEAGLQRHPKTWTMIKKALPMKPEKDAKYCKYCVGRLTLLTVIEGLVKTLMRPSLPLANPRV